MSDKNYTTKPIELPLSTEKEYVLVDIEIYREICDINAGIIKEVNITAPFKPEEISKIGNVLFCGKTLIDSVTEAECFREVVREIPHTPQEDDAFNAIQSSSGAVEDGVVEWDDADLPPVGVECELSNCGGGWVRAKILFVGTGLCVVDHGYGDQHYHLNSVKFRHLETEAERKGREIKLRAMTLTAMKDIDAEEGDRSTVEGVVYRMIAAGYRKEKEQCLK